MAVMSNQAEILSPSVPASDPSPSARDSGEIARSAPATVLLVDDEPKIRQQLQRALADEDFEVLAVASALDARALVAERLFDILVDDGDVFAGQDGFARRDKAGEAPPDHEHIGLRDTCFAGHPDSFVGC